MQVKHPKVHAKLVLLGNIRLQATSWRALPGVAATLDHTGMAQAQPPKVPVRHALNAIKAKFNSEVAAGPQTHGNLKNGGTVEKEKKRREKRRNNYEDMLKRRQFLLR